MAGKNQFGISQKLLLVLLLVALLPLLSIWLLSYRSIADLTEAKVDSELTSVNNELITYVNGWVEMNERMLKQNADLSAMKSMRAAEQNPALISMAKFYDWAYLVFTTDSQGNNIGRSDSEDLRFYGDRSYFRQVIEGRPFGKQVLIGKTSGEPALVLSTAITDGAGRLTGVLAQAMTLANLSGRIVSKQIGTTGFSFLVDEKNEVIAHPDVEWIKARMDLSRHPAVMALQKGASSIIFENETGAKVVAVAAKTEQGWTIVSQQNYSEAYQLIRSENRKAVVLLVITLVIVILISFLISRWLTAPIRSLTEVADKYSQGDLELKISGLDRQDEIGQLGQAIDRLGTSIRLALDRLQRKKN